METVSYDIKEVETAKNLLLNNYFQKKVEAGEMNLIQALLKQKQIDKDFEKGEQEVANGDYVDADNLMDTVKKMVAESREL